MKLIIELEDDIAKGIRGENECEVEPREIVRSFQATIADAIANGTPYNPSGDLISREALIREIGRTDEWHKGRSVCDIIDNAMSMHYTFLPQYQTDLQCAYDCGYEKGKHERPQVTVFAEDADEKAVADMKEELQSVIEPRPKGEWVLKEEDCDDGGNNRYECTNCHYSDVHAGSAEVPYCWHCGAEMQKGGAE